MGESKANGIKILVVEDEQVISRVCMRILRAEGFEVDIAINGQIAKDMVSKKEYALCLIDIRTPIMNGMELYQCLKEEHPELASRVLFTSGDVLSSSIAGFLREANRPYLRKPFTPDELRTAVAETLKQKMLATSWGKTASE